MAGNEFITPQVVARLAYATLYKTIVMAGLVFRNYDSDFDGAVGDTITVRKPAVFEADEYDRKTGLKIQDAQEDSFSVTLDKLLDVSFKVTSEQWTLEIADFHEQLIVPAVEALRQKIDAVLIAEAIANFSLEVGSTSGREWDNPRSLIDAGMVLNQHNVPETDRNAVIGPITHAGWLDDPLTNRADQSGTTEGLRNASVGRLFGFDNYMSQGISGDPEESLAFHRSALALVARTLAPPQGAAKAASFGADGIGLRVVFDYDTDQKEDIISLDTLVGTKTLDSERGVIITEGGS